MSTVNVLLKKNVCKDARIKESYGKDKGRTLLNISYKQYLSHKRQTFERAVSYMSLNHQYICSNIS